MNHVVNLIFSLHGQVQEVVGVMKQNIDKILDRDVALNNLVTRADDLQSSATTYNQTTKQLRNKYWWKNAKVRQDLIDSNLIFILFSRRMSVSVQLFLRLYSL